MPTQLRTRVALLIGLAVLGILLAGISSALWTGNPAGAPDNAGEFIVTRQNVTVTDSSQNQTVIQTVSDAEAIEIKQVSSRRFSVRTDGTTALNRSQRSRAKQIARNNETIETLLTGSDAYDLRVKPIQQLSAEQSISGTANITTISTRGSNDGNATTQDAETLKVEVENVTTDSDSVVVKRDPKYVQNEAVVEVFGPNDEHRYTVHVDLANTTVSDISERSNSPPTRTAAS